MKRIIKDLNHRNLFCTSSFLSLEINPKDINMDIIKKHRPQLTAFANKLSAIKGNDLFKNHAKRLLEILDEAK